MRNSKLAIALFSLLLLDIVRPFGLYLRVEFLILGVIFVALYFSLPTALICALGFGYAKDVFLGSNSFLNTIEFPALAVLIHQMLPFRGGLAHKKTQLRIAYALLSLLTIVFHIICNTIISGVIFTQLMVEFSLTTFVLSFLVFYLLERWLLPHHTAGLH